MRWCPERESPAPPLRTRPGAWAAPGRCWSCPSEGAERGSVAGTDGDPAEAAHRVQADVLGAGRRVGDGQGVAVAGARGALGVAGGAGPAAVAVVQVRVTRTAGGGDLQPGGSGRDVQVEVGVVAVGGGLVAAPAVLAQFPGVGAGALGAGATAEGEGPARGRGGALVVGDGQLHRVGAGGRVGLAGVGGGRGGSVTEVPGPGGDGAVGVRGLVGEGDRQALHGGGEGGGGCLVAGRVGAAAAVTGRAARQPGVPVAVVARADGAGQVAAGGVPVARAVVAQHGVHVGGVLLQHVPDGEVAPAVDARGVVAVGGVEEGAQGVGAAACLGHGLGVGDTAVGVGDVLRESLDPPDRRGGDAGVEVAVHVEPAVEVVRVLVVEVPDLEVRAQPLGLVGDEARLVAGRRRVTLDVHAAVVGVDAVHGTGVRLVVGAGVEDHDLDRAVAVVGDGAAVVDDAVEVRVLVAQAGAARRQLARGHLLGLDGDAGTARVGHRQHRVGQLRLQVAGAVVGAVGLVVVVGHLGHADPERSGGARDGARVQQAGGQRTHLRPQRGLLQEPAEFASRVGREVGLVGPQQREVAGGEAVQGVDQARVRPDGRHEGGQLVAAERHGVDVVDRVEHPPGRVPRGVVVRQQSLEDVDVAGVLLGAVDEGDGLGEGLTVGVGDVAGVRAGEEGVQTGAYGGLQAAAVGAHRAGVVVVDVVAGPQVEDQLGHAGAGVAGIGRRAVA